MLKNMISPSIEGLGQTLEEVARQGARRGWGSQEATRLGKHGPEVAQVMAARLTDSSTAQRGGAAVARQQAWRVWARAALRGHSRRGGATRGSAVGHTGEGGGARRGERGGSGDLGHELGE
jgi:hypothetical protein